MALEPLWRKRGLKDNLLVQQETSTGVSCAGSPKQEGEWAEVEQDFRQQNMVERLLQHALPINIQYSFIPKSEIEEEDARARLQAGATLGVFGPTEYATVSSVGFNRDRTKAMVYVHLRSSGYTDKWELRDGMWRRAGYVCMWET